MIILKAPENGKSVSLLTKEQLAFLASDRTNDIGEEFDPMELRQREGRDCTFPKELEFCWEAPETAHLQLAEVADFHLLAVEKAARGCCRISNLKSGTRYYWRVICGKEISHVRCFETDSQCPRFLLVDGLTNVRDCGGWIGSGGRRIRQGLLYRGSELNSHVVITEAGLRTMREEMKIKSVLDLRHEREIVVNVYGENYCNVPIDGTYYKWFERPWVPRRILEFLSKKENYPVYFHCWGGADRTGLVAFVLGAVLGMSYEDLMDDYEITTLSKWYKRSRNTEGRFKLFFDRFSTYPGSTMEEKARNYLLSCEIPEEQIDRFRIIMLEKQTEGKAI